MTNRLPQIWRMLINGMKITGTLRSHMSGKGTIRENRLHMEAGAAWLTRAQKEGSGGFSRRYCFYGGWDRPYIETTGYIIPTMLAVGKHLKNDAMISQAEQAAQWLLRMQKENGAFCDSDSGAELAFDTGQVLTGLLAAFHEWKDARFMEAAVRAGTWLADVQEQDGTWYRYAYQQSRHTYYVKVAAALLELGALSGDSRHYDAAIKNISWTLGCQAENGYFRHMEFRKGEYPFLHTIAYVIEGLLDAYARLGDSRLLDAAMRSIAALSQRNREREMLLCSQYADDWEPVNSERCVPGLAQWACIAMRAYDLSGNADLLTHAVKTLYYLKSKQYLHADDELFGGLPGSVPLWGSYLSFCYPNWTIKFFLDALLHVEKYAAPLWREQEIWVAEAFRFSDAVVHESLGANDREYLKRIERVTDTKTQLTLLDVGCGKGKFIKYFARTYPQWTVTGIDPSFADGDRIRKGSIYALPVPDGYADIVLLIEVLQHVDDLGRAMSELSRVIKPGGLIVIGDRDPFSIIGILKPLMELAGRWMYPWDSAFREQWRSVQQWKAIFDNGWTITSAQSFDDPDNRIPLSNRFYLLTARREPS